LRENYQIAMPWVNYHSHSLYCDGKAAPEDFIARAVENGFRAYGFTSHAPVPFDSRWNMPAGRLQEYLDHFKLLREQWKHTIQLYCGLEVDFIEGVWGYEASGLHEKGLDYCIGSVHYINRFPDGSYFCFDVPTDAFFNGIEQLYHNDFRAALSGYYQTLRNMLQNDPPDVIGHMDKIKKHNTARAFFSEDEKWYRDQVEETLDLIASTGCILEVNTNGLYRHNPPMLYPSSWILKSAYRRKIPVMMNSDSHHPDEIEKGFSETSRVLKEIGYQTLRVLYNGFWQDRPFTEKGVEF
jgi:histidinol-phosphatase (PHP family)